MRSHARVVVIGGGIAGCSVLYHLVRMGWRDVALIERQELTSGSTWHAAGNCPTFSTSYNVMKLQAYGVELYKRLEAETGQPVGHHATGSIRLAHGCDRLDEYGHVRGMAALLGLDYEILTPAEIKGRYPFIETHDLLGGLWDPHDGHVDPSQLTQALAKGARDGGAVIHRNAPVEAISRTASGEWEVRAGERTVTCEIVVNAAGFRAGEVAAMVGRDLPMVSMEHQYLVTDAIAALDRYQGELPLLRDPDRSYYLRQEGKGLILGPYEWDCRPWAADGVPPGFGMELLPPDLDRLDVHIGDAMGRVPILAEGGVKNVVNGPITYAPDGLPLIGPAYGLENFYHCTAFSFGIVQGGGAGKVMAEIIVEGEAEWDTWELDPRRYGDYATKRYVVDRAVELYQREYAIAFPHEERPAGRPARTTPLYHRLAAKGAMFGARGGWERATWFVPEGTAATERPSFRRTDWFAAVGEECRAVRERVGVLDLGGFSKFEVAGAGAEAFLDRLCAGRIPTPGRIALAYMCTPKGGVLAEFTITRLDRDRFYLCSAAPAERHDHQWMLSHLPDGGAGDDVRIANLTPARGTLVLAGPRARDVLARVTEADLSNEAFPWLSAREMVIGFATVLALRINYVGELGWELHVPIDHHVSVYEEVMAAGAEFGIADFGMYAMDSLRLEKAYPAWKVELTTEYTPLEAGLERFVRLDKADFIGREALRRQRDAGLARRLVCLTVEADDADCQPNAPVFASGAPVGQVTSGGYGHWVGESIALAYVDTAASAPGTELEVDVLGVRRPAVVAAGPLHDPANERPRA